MPQIIKRTELTDSLKVGHDTLMLETRFKSTTVVIAGAIGWDTSQAVDERGMQHCVSWNVAVGTFVQGKADFGPLLANQLPASNSWKRFYWTISL